MVTDFQTNVFINCPFDEKYKTLLKPLLFTIVALGFTPRIALERADSAEQRISKICGLIGESKYSIHDLSRLKSSTEEEYYRQNMPFELGIDYGSRKFHPGLLQHKRFIILATTRFDYMRALSDLSGVDIQAHEDKPRTLIRKLRNWFYSTVGITDIPGPTKIWYAYNDFNTDLHDKLENKGFSPEDIQELIMPEFIDYVERWVKSFPL